MPKELNIYITFLFIFIFINVSIYFLIQLKGGEKLFRKLFLYWLSCLFVFILEGAPYGGKLYLGLSFLVNILPIAIMSNFLLSTYNYKFKFKFYLKAIPVAITLSLIANFFDAPFFVISFPIALVAMGPLIEGLYVSLIVHKDKKQISKTIACFLYVSGILCCLNYAIFRYNASQLQSFIGFGSAFISYIMCSMLLPIVCIQMINDKKTDLLETLVKDRTSELLESKHEKENLLRVLVHDISNPLQAAMFQISLAKKVIPGEVRDIDLVNKVNKSLNSIKDIITHVKEYECVISGIRTAEFSDVLLSECLKEVEEMFSERYKQKNVSLLIHNKLSENTKIRVDKTPFIHSVASNLVSNALKFSKPDSVVLILVSEKESNIVIEVVDQGIGMSQTNLKNLFEISDTVSRLGTMGETGTGFGMPIVKAYTTLFGGRIEANSSQVLEESGTTISLYLPNFERLQQSNSQTYLQ